MRVLQQYLDDRGYLATDEVTGTYDYAPEQADMALQGYNDINKGKPKPVISVEEAQAQANEIYRWHKATFVDYWRFLNKEARAAQSEGYTTSADGWFYFADRTTAFTKLMNFPMQSNGAVMLREAVKMLAFETDLDVACTLHDAIYVNCREEEVVEVVPILT